jgi:hypothetical protein
MDATELRERLRKSGYSPLPLNGKAPSMMEGWQNKLNTDKDEIALWATMWPAATNTGVLTRFVPTLDIDIMYPDAASAVEALVRERYEDGGYILTRTGKAPKRAILFRTDEPFDKIAVPLSGPNGDSHKIEFLCDGQQVVVDGIHPDTRLPYRWHGGQPDTIRREELPYIRGEEARTLVGEIIDLLVREFDFKRAGKSAHQKRHQHDNGDGNDRAAWAELLADIAGGRSLHDSIIRLAMMLLRSGMTDGAAVNMIKGAMKASATPRDERWQDRYNDIWRAVKTARDKIDGEAETQQGAKQETKADSGGTAQAAELFDPWQRYIVPAFPLEILPPTIKYFVATQSEVIGCDRSALAMAVLAALSGAIDHRFALKIMQYGNWWASPRLWVLLVGDPSIKKTPIINTATDSIDHLQADGWKRYQNDKKEYVAAGGDPDAFRQPPPRYTAYDTTTEKLGVILSNQDRGILIKRDELVGWIGQMEKYATGRGSFADRAFWLKAYDGGPFTVDRISRGDVRISNLSVSIIGGAQPQRLAELHGLISDGLLQRFLPILVNGSSFPIDRPTTAEAEHYAQLLCHLAELEPQKLWLADDAVSPMTKLRRYLHDLEQTSAGIADGFQGFVGKLAGVAGSLALILTIVRNIDHTQAEVQRTTIEDITMLMQEFILPHALEFYRKAAAIDPLQRLASWILTSGKTRIVPSDLTVNVADCRGLGLWEINQRVSPLVAGGWLTTKDIGPLAKSWAVNPAIHDHFRERAREEERRKSTLAGLMNSPRGADRKKPSAGGMAGEDRQ